MNEIAQKKPFTVKRRNVYWIIQLIFVIMLVGFVYSFIQNRDLSQGIQDINDITSGQPTFVNFIYGAYGGGEFEKPMAVMVANNLIYISDTNKKRVQIYDYDGNPLKIFGKAGTKPGQFLFPYGLASDSKGNVYVADLFNGNISKFDMDGKFLGIFVKKGSLKSPAGLTIKNDLMYVTDVVQNTVKVFDLNGKLVLNIGKKGTAPGQFYAPNAISVSGDGTIYVTDTGNSRVQVFDKNGKFLRIINGSKDGKGKSMFVNPRGIALDDRGNVYVLSNLTHLLYAFDKDGKSLFAMGGRGEGEKQFSLPNGLFVDQNNRLYVSDTTNLRISVFQLQ